MPDPSIARRIANFADQLAFDDLPADVVERSKYFMLDCVGIAYASTGFEFAGQALGALSSLGGGDHPVIGYGQRLSLRDATMLNGILVHGLDYDDTHTGAVCHASASAFPAALGAAAANGATGRDLLIGYVLAIEVSTRLGLAANGAFHEIGFHPTGLVGAFGSAVAAAGINIEDLRMAAGEAHAMVLAEAADGADLVCEFFLGERALTLRMSVSATDPGRPDYESFGWQVLSTLASEVAAETDPQRFTVTLTTTSDLSAASDPPSAST